jgi:hypothetical protein
MVRSSPSPTGTKTGTATAYLVYRAQTPGKVTIGGAGIDDALIVSSSAYVKVVGLIVENVGGGDGKKCVAPCTIASLQANRAAARITGSHHIIFEDVVARHNLGTGIGVDASHHVTVRGAAPGACASHDNGLNGIGGLDMPASKNLGRVLVKGCDSYNNNTKWKYNPYWEGGGGKWYITDRVTIDGGRIYNNWRNGIWFDYQNTNFVVRNIEGYSNPDGAVVTEINAGPGVVQNSNFHDGTGVAIWESMGVSVLNNKFTSSGITFRNMRSRSPYYVYDVTIRDNQFTSSSVGANAGNDLSLDMLKNGAYTNCCCFQKCTAKDGNNNCTSWADDTSAAGKYPTGCALKRCVKDNPGLGWSGC